MDKIKATEVKAGDLIVVERSTIAKGRPNPVSLKAPVAVRRDGVSLRVVEVVNVGGLRRVTFEGGATYSAYGNEKFFGTVAA